MCLMKLRMQARVERLFDKNFENILFANANFEVFDAELRKWRQSDSDDGDANEWWNKSISNVFFVLKNGQKHSDRNPKTVHAWLQVGARLRLASTCTAITMHENGFF